MRVTALPFLTSANLTLPTRRPRLRLEHGQKKNVPVFSLGTKGIWCLLLSFVTSRIHTLKARSELERLCIFFLCIRKVFGVFSVLSFVTSRIRTLKSYPLFVLHYVCMLYIQYCTECSFPLSQVVRVAFTVCPPAF